MTDIRFTDLSLSDSLLEALNNMGYEYPTPVQASAIPLAGSGSDLMVQSQTGTGKTAAFSIPVVEKLTTDKGIHALMLCPTRELAKQVADECTALGQIKGIRCAAVYGGASMNKQIAEMRFAHIVVGTPGRILDHLTRKTIDFNNVSFLVLDEADEMLSMGFARELEQIMRHIPEQRQTLLFSATIPPDIKRYAKRYMKNPEFLSLIEENVAADDVEHHYYMVSGVARTRDLARVIELEQPETAIIFANTRKDTETVARYLKKKGMNAEFLNSDLPQKERERVMALTKAKELRFLVATDIAARGIDVSQLSHVINYTLPESPEVYIHRTGRTGRAGSKGTAISLIGPREIGVFYYLKRLYNVALIEKPIPTQTEIELHRQEQEVATTVDELRSSVHPSELAPDTKNLASLILERDEAVDIVQILLHHFKNRSVGPAQANAPSFGGLLNDVPKPDRLAPGARAQSLSGVAERVAAMRSEFRGLPASSQTPTASNDSASIESPTQEIETPVTTPETGVDASSLNTAPAVDEIPETKKKKAPKKKSRSADAKDKSHSAQKQKADGTPKTKKASDKKTNAKKSAKGSNDKVEAESGANEKSDAPSVEAVAKPPKAAAKSSESNTDLVPDGMVRIFCSLGRRDGLSSSTIKDTIAELAGLLPSDLVDIDVRTRHTFLLVSEEYAEDLIAAVNGESIGKRSIRIEVAQPR